MEGSRLGGMFGYVTPEDQLKWQQMREANDPHVNKAKEGLKAMMDSMFDATRRRLDSQLRAADQVAATADFEESNTRSVSKRWDSRTQSIVETVDFEPLDDRTPIDTDFDPYVEHQFGS